MRPATYPCGTEAAYTRHIRHGEKPCDPCRLAHNAARNRYRRIRKAKTGERRWTMTDKILDFLELDAGWLTAASLAMELGHHEDSIKRALLALRKSGRVRSRVVEMARASGSAFDSRTEWRVV